MAKQAGDRSAAEPDHPGSRATPPAPLRPSRLLLSLVLALLPLLLAELLPATLIARPVLSALHGILLLFLVATSGATFAVQWYAADSGLEEALGRFVGAAFLGLAVLEGYHLLALPGMPGFQEAAIRDHAAAWWHGARGWMAVTLIGAALVPRHSHHPLLRRGPIAALALAAAAALFAFEVLTVEPGSLVLPGGGPTRARLASELALALLCLGGAALHSALHRRSGEPLYRRVSIALVLSAIGQGAYALSGDGLDLLGTVAHVYSAVAGWVVFDTLFASAVLDPYRRLAETTRQLQASNQYLERLRGRIEGELAETIGRLAASTEREAGARAELEAAIAAVPEAILVVAPDGQVVRQNDVARQLLAAAPSDPRSDSAAARWSELRARSLDGRPIALEDQPVERALRGETVRGLVMEVRPPGRKPSWISASCAPIRAEQRIVGAVAAVADVSDLQELQGRLEDVLRAVSHDLRNPLQIILLQGERLLRLAEGEGKDRERRSAAAVVAASRLMGGMIRDLVDAARMESGRLKLACRPLDLRSWLPDMLALSAGPLDPGRVKLALPPDLPLAWADPERLDRVFVNLLGNALSHSGERGEVLVSAAAAEAQLRVSVRDSGAGIAPEDLPHVFERFYRGRAAHQADGLGLGLFITRLLVEAHGGSIAAESPPGQGATFTFTLPVALPQATRA